MTTGEVPALVWLLAGWDREELEPGDAGTSRSRAASASGLKMTRRLGTPGFGIAETRRNHRVKAIQLGDIYSDTADAFYLLGLDASLASVSKRAVAALILVRHSFVRIALVCGTGRLTERRRGDLARGCVEGYHRRHGGHVNDGGAGWCLMLN